MNGEISRICRSRNKFGVLVFDMIFFPIRSDVIGMVLVYDLSFPLKAISLGNRVSGCCHSTLSYDREGKKVDAHKTAFFSNPAVFSGIG